MTVYRLYGAPGRASAAPEAVLEEIGAAYEYVDVSAEERSGAAYRKLNPFGQVPTLVDGDRVIWESAAICAYLCDRHESAGLAPAPAAPERGRFYQWLFFLSNTLQPAYMLYIYPERYGSEPAGVAAVREAAGRRVAELWQHVEELLIPGPFLLGTQLSACDIYLYMLSTWHRDSIVPLARFARVSRLRERVAARPGVQRMLERNRGH